MASNADHVGNFYHRNQSSFSPGNLKRRLMSDNNLFSNLSPLRTDEALVHDSESRTKIEGDRSPHAGKNFLALASLASLERVIEQYTPVREQIRNSIRHMHHQFKQAHLLKSDTSSEQHGELYTKDGLDAIFQELREAHSTLSQVLSSEIGQINRIESITEQGRFIRLQSDAIFQMRTIIRRKVQENMQLSEALVLMTEKMEGFRDIPSNWKQIADEHAVLFSEKAEYDTNVHNLKQELIHSQSVINRLQHSVEQLTNSLKNSVQKDVIVELESQINGLSQQLEAKSDVSGITIAENEALKGRITQLDIENKNLVQQFQATEQKVHALDAAAKEREEEIESLQSEIKANAHGMSQVQGLQDQIEALQAQLAAATTQISETKVSSSASARSNSSNRSLGLGTRKRQTHKRLSLHASRSSVAQMEEDGCKREIKKCMANKGLDSVQGFRALDTEQNGFISASEFALKCISILGVDEQFHSAMNGLGNSMMYADGLIDCSRFASMLGDQYKDFTGQNASLLTAINRAMREKKLNVKTLFSAMDRDGGGTLSRNEMRQGLASVLDISINPGVALGLLSAMDEDQSGEIEIAELYDVITRRFQVFE